MLVPYANNTISWIPLAVLVASLLGSGHCVAMCGGLILASTRTKMDLVFYHLGRLFGYLALGFLAGWMGKKIFEPLSEESIWLFYASWISVLFMGIWFILSGVKMWKNQSLHFSVVPSHLLSRLYKKAGKSSFSMGLLTALLPCGWLHTFVLGSVATQSPLAGAGFLFAFWLGTLPALSVAPWLVQKIFQPISRYSPRASAMILISVGLMSIGTKVLPSLMHKESSHQHLHQKNDCH